jgi:hypothetical protein
MGAAGMKKRHGQILTSYVSTKTSLATKGCRGVGNFTDVTFWKLH